MKDPFTNFIFPDMSPRNFLCLFLLHSLTITASVIAVESSPSRSSSCHPDQRDALSRFNNSFSIPAPSHLDYFYFCGNTSYPKTNSWREDLDCCSWEGVQCDPLTGDVVGLDLSCARLRGAINSRSSLFSLRHLRSLSLSGNDLLGSTIPPEISVFSGMTHLNFSSSNISGNVPRGISRLSKLVSLDLSDNWLEMQNPTMRMIVRNLTQLEELHLSSTVMSTVDITSLMNLTSSLTSLVIADCWLGGKFPEYIIQLPNLQHLDLSMNPDIYGILPESNWSRSLAFLSLENCYFTGEVPRSIGNLSRLTSLDLSWNNFTGHVDFRIFSTLKNLQFLGLSSLSVGGDDVMDASNKFPKLEKLVILQGSLNNFPCFLSSMPELRELSLSQSIVSEFPGPCINNGLLFPQLQTLDMELCNLTKFPSLMSHSNKLRIVALGGNMIKEIPEWFWGAGIDTLEELYLNNNLLNGGLRLPWKRLARLFAQNNLFEGPLPIPITQSISEFLASQNRFNGSISPSICQLTHLQNLELAENNLMGVIPQCLGNITDLWRLDLSRNSLTGPLPSSLVNCTSMWTLDVSYNSISGTPVWIPTGSLRELHLQANNFIGRWPGDIFLRSTYLESIDLSINKFEGPLPLPSYTIYYYSVSNNHFSGEISSLICNATNLQLLDLSNNDISNALPHCLENITTNLIYLNLRANEFHGLIPEIFPQVRRLKYLDISRNQFEGSLPRSLSNCESLEVLNVGSNKIVDSFPDWLGDLPLKVLSLRSNKFRGSVNVSEGIHPFSRVHILDLSNNDFDGNLPDNIINEMFDKTQGDDYGYGDGSDSVYLANGDLADSDRPEFYSVMINLKGVEIEMVKINVQFAILDMSRNHFSGELPRNIGLLESLKGLNFSHNGFVGTIPPSVGNLTNLEWLDLSSNHLVGEIPKELVRLTSLGYLDLSRNNLTGPIPLGGQINTFSNRSFEGNPRLCGIPLTRPCGLGNEEARQPPDQRGEGEGGGWLEWRFVAMGLGSGLVIGISLGHIALETGRPLWLSRMVIQLEASCSKKSKNKDSRRNCWRWRRLSPRPGTQANGWSIFNNTDSSHAKIKHQIRERENEHEAVGI